ncbi:glycosyltransferase family 2 protein [Georgenia sp. Marseille-Q6866]
MRAIASVSVVIPAFNAANLVGGAISSALTQSRAPREILVVDDGSTDATSDVVGAYPPPVRLLQQANGGVSQARNTALREARGDFIALLDADDQFLPDHLERCLAVWKSHVARVGHERVVVTGNACRLTRHGITTSTILRPNFPPPGRQRERIMQGNFTGIFAVYPRQLHEEVGLFDPALRRGEDRDLWTRAIFSGWHIVPQREPHAIYRMGEASLSAAHDHMASAELHVLSKTRDLFSSTLTAAEKDYLDLRLSSPAPRVLVREANDLIRTSSWPDAAAHLRQAARMLPSDRRIRLRAWMARHRWAHPALSVHLRMSDRRLRRVSE